MFRAGIAVAGVVSLALVLGCASDDGAGAPSADGSAGTGSSAKAGSGAAAGSGASSNPGGGEGIVEAANLDADQPASELTSAEAGELCMAGNASLTRELSCTTDAVARTDDAAECESLRDSCASKPSEDDCDAAQTQADLAECSTVTVGEIAACLDEIVGWMKTLSCDEPADEGTRPACMETLHGSCPMLFGGGGDSGDQGGAAGSGA